MVDSICNKVFLIFITLILKKGFALFIQDVSYRLLISHRFG